MIRAHSLNLIAGHSWIVIGRWAITKGTIQNWSYQDKPIIFKKVFATLEFLSTAEGFLFCFTITASARVRKLCLSCNTEEVKMNTWTSCEEWMEAYNSMQLKIRCCNMCNPKKLQFIQMCRMVILNNNNLLNRCIITSICTQLVFVHIFGRIFRQIAVLILSCFLCSLQDCAASSSYLWFSCFPP